MSGGRVSTPGAGPGAKPARFDEWLSGFGVSIWSVALIGVAGFTTALHQICRTRDLTVAEQCQLHAFRRVGELLAQMAANAKRRRFIKGVMPELERRLRAAEVATAEGHSLATLMAEACGERRSPSGEEGRA